MFNSKEINIKSVMLKEKLVCPFDESGLFFSKNKARCNNCGRTFDIENDVVFFSSVPSDVEKNTKGYLYQSWSNWRKANYDFYNNQIANYGHNLTVLDVGAGPTQFIQLFKEFENYVGIDFYPYKFVKVVSDLNNKLPYQDNVFDMIILSNVIEHIDNTEFLISECYRVLKPGGVLLATVPFLMRIHQKPYDFNRYTIYKLESLFSKIGFFDIKIDSLGNPYDVFITTRGHFWQYAINNKFFDVKIINWVVVVFLKFIKKGIYIFDVLLSFIFSKIKKENDFTLGYSVVAKKKIKNR